MKVFISHADVNKKIAKTLANALEDNSSEVETFVSSRPGDISADEEWFASIIDGLKKADAYLILLTPDSVLRPWVNFEAGAGWFSKKILIFARIDNLPINDIHLPLNKKQIYSIEDEEGLNAIFKELNIQLDNPTKWTSKLKEVTNETIPIVSEEMAWEGATIDGTFYAWAGPLLGLDDKDSETDPKNLCAEIKNRGLTPRWTSRDNIQKSKQNGYSQVFATDKNTWRRPITNGEHFLFAGKSKKNKEQGD